MTEATRTRSMEAEPIAAFDLRVPEHGALVVSDAEPRPDWREALRSWPIPVDVLAAAAREGVARGAAAATGAASTARLRSSLAVASAHAALLDAPDRLREGAWRAAVAAGFGPLCLLLFRHPSLAIALGAPVLIASLFLMFWSGVSAALLGLWCVTMSLVFAGQAAREMLGDDAGSTKLLPKEMPS